MKSRAALETVETSELTNVVGGAKILLIHPDAGTMAWQPYAGNRDAIQGIYERRGFVVGGFRN
jgi:hypothetical protein